MNDTPILIRQAHDADLPFFFASTLNSYFYSSKMTAPLTPSTYYAEHKDVLGRLLMRRGVNLIMAVLPADQDVITGFVLSEPGVLHYMYTKKVFRGFGIARRLLDLARVDLVHCLVSHWTHDLEEMKKTGKYPEMTYNPYLLGRL